MEYVVAKDPDEVQDYTIDWSADLASGETIVTSTWTVPSGITKDSDTNDDTSATAWLSGGTAGEEYICTNEITTNANPARTYQKSIVVPVLNG